MGHDGEYEARIYRPKHQKQKRLYGGSLIGCTETSFAMGVDAVTFGGCIVTEDIVRGLSNEAQPNPASPGLNQAQLVEVAGDLHIAYVSRVGGSWASLVAELNRNRRAVIQLWYSDIGGSGIGHAVLAQAIRENQEDRFGRSIPGKAMLINDPMKTAPEWISTVKVKRAMETLATKEGLGSGLFYGVFTRTLPYVAAGAD